jgi:hypothetical protein
MSTCWASARMPRVIPSRSPPGCQVGQGRVEPARFGGQFGCAFQQRQQGGADHHPQQVGEIAPACVVLADVDALGQRFQVACQCLQAAAGLPVGQGRVGRPRIGGQFGLVRQQRRQGRADRHAQQVAQLSGFVRCIVAMRAFEHHGAHVLVDQLPHRAAIGRPVLAFVGGFQPFAHVAQFAVQAAHAGGEACSSSNGPPACANRATSADEEIACSGRSMAGRLAAGAATGRRRPSHRPRLAMESGSSF